MTGYHFLAAQAACVGGMLVSTQAYHHVVFRPQGQIYGLVVSFSGATTSNMTLQERPSKSTSGKRGAGLSPRGRTVGHCLKVRHCLTLPLQGGTAGPWACKLPCQ